MTTAPKLPINQSLDRAVRLLKILTGPYSSGLSLSEITIKTGLHHSTVIRYLNDLSALQLIKKRENTKRYTLGPLVYELGLLAQSIFDIRELCAIPMQRLAKKHKETVYVVQRSGDDAVCIGRVDGEDSRRILTIEPGTRRPLGVGAGGLAVLMGLSASERQAIVGNISMRLKDYLNLDPSELQRMIRQSIADNYALSRNRVTAGVSAVGVPIYNQTRHPFAAISIATTHSRLSDQRIKEIVSSLWQESRHITEALECHTAA